MAADTPDSANRQDIAGRIVLYFIVPGYPGLVCDAFNKAKLVPKAMLIHKHLINRIILCFL